MSIENIEKEFPGNPHYDAKDDIMDGRNNKEVDVDVENLSRQDKRAGLSEGQSDPEESMSGDAELTGVETNSEKNEFDITSEDLLALGETERQFGLEIGKEGDQLDVPGSEEDDANEKIGEEDEENNYYSLGGDAHDNLEEDQG